MLTPPSSYISHILEALSDQIQMLNRAIKCRDYKHIKEYASITIDCVYEQKQLLLALLDARSYALSMSGQFNKAYLDTVRMLDTNPTAISGYARMGQVLSMYGHQHYAINVYKNGLDVSRQIQLQTSLRPAGTDNLEREKDMAIKLLRKKMDPILTLPNEAITNVLMLLSQDERVVCIQVSTVWRKRVLDCADAWRDLYLGRGSHDMPLVRIASYLGDHVNNLLITSSTSEIVRSTFLRSLKNSHFDRIRFIRLETPSRIQKNIPEFVADISIALHETRNTLTHLDIDVQSNSNFITISTILSACINLQLLKYSTFNNLSTHVGDFTTFLPHYTLINLEIEAHLISGESIETIIHHCQQLRRLALSGCDISVLDILTRNTTANMEILGYNCDLKNVPQLKKNREIRKEIGLRHLYLQAAFMPLDSRSAITKILPFMYKNRITLETIDVELPLNPGSFSSTTEETLQQLLVQYPDFKFGKIKSLSFFGPSMIQDGFLLRSIQHSTTLKILNLSRLYYTDKFVNTLLKMPPLQRVEIIGLTTIVPSDIITPINDDYETGLSRLFARYAHISNFASSLESVILENHYEGSDSTLKTLAQVKTLREVSFTALHQVSAAGMMEFFTKIGKQLTSINLGFMNCVEDNLLAVLVFHGSSLSTIYLRHLKNVTDQGIKTLVNKAPSSLRELKIMGCRKVTESWVMEARRKIKTVYFSVFTFPSIQPFTTDNKTLIEW